MKISKNLSLYEVVKSNTAKRLNIDNIPSDSHIENLKYLAEKVFQPLRDWAKCPIYISSGYRSHDLNEAIGGSPRSFHSHGMALDLDQDNRNTEISNSELFHYIKDNLPFTELIWEFGTVINPNWVHVAIAKGRENEKNIKIAKKINGRTTYSKWGF